MADAAGLLGPVPRKCVPEPDGPFAGIDFIINYETDALICTVYNERNYTAKMPQRRMISATLPLR